MAPQTIEMPTQDTAMAAEYPQLQAVLHGAGGGAWTREISLTLALAAQTGVHLDESMLIYSDVRDLQSLQEILRLRQAKHGK